MPIKTIKHEKLFKRKIKSEVSGAFSFIRGGINHDQTPGLT